MLPSELSRDIGDASTVVHGSVVVFARRAAAPFLIGGRTRTGWRASAGRCGASGGGAIVTEATGNMLYGVRGSGVPVLTCTDGVSDW